MAELYAGETANFAPNRRSRPSVSTGWRVAQTKVFDVELSPEDMAAIATLDRKGSSFFDHRAPRS